MAENGEVGDKVLHLNVKVSPMYSGFLLVKEKPTNRVVHTPVWRRQTGSWASLGRLEPFLGREEGLGPPLT